MAEHTALIQFPPPRPVYLITKGPGLLSIIIYSELDLEASGLETGNQEQNGNRILFVIPAWPLPPDCLPRLQAASRACRTSLRASRAVPERHWLVLGSMHSRCSGPGRNLSSKVA